MTELSLNRWLYNTKLSDFIAFQIWAESNYDRNHTKPPPYDPGYCRMSCQHVIGFNHRAQAAMMMAFYIYKLTGGDDWRRCCIIAVDFMYNYNPEDRFADAKA